MKRTWKAWLAGMLAVLMLVPATAWAAEAEDKYQELAELIFTEYFTNSAQYALMDNGEIVLSGVLGEDGLDQNTVYGIGSTSKVFTAAVMMKLVDEGRILLDAPVNTYIPEFTMADDRYGAITIRMLLNHSSGLMGSTYPNTFLWDDNDTRNHDTLLEELSKQRLKADPGAYSVYCNDGFTLAEIVAERVTGKTFTALLHEYITDPLGLERTMTPQDDVSALSFAPIYMDGIRMPNMANMDGMRLPNESVNFIGTGGIYSTAEELAAFGQVFTGEVQVLSDAARNATMEKEYLKGHWVDAEYNIYGYGLGWSSVDLYPFSQYGITALEKGGDTMNNHASLIVLPEHNLSVAVLSSGLYSSSMNEALATQILMDRLVENGVIQEVIEAPEALYTEADYKALDFEPATCNGYYTNAYNNVYSVTIDENGVLTFGPAAYPEYAQQYYYVGDHKFVSETGILVFSFEVYQDTIYLVQEMVSAFPGLSVFLFTTYMAQRIPDNQVEDSVMEAWQERDGNRYWAVNEKHTSELYSLDLEEVLVSVELDEAFPGYMNSAKIEDETTARGWVTIPINNGRDLKDFVFVVEEGIEYLHKAGFVMMSEAGMETLYPGTESQSTIQENGYTRWYHIGEEHDGKSMTVSCPDTAGFILYDAERNFVTQSAITGSDTATLPAGGLIGFAGEVGDVFVIHIEY